MRLFASAQNVCLAIALCSIPALAPQLHAQSATGARKARVLQGTVTLGNGAPAAKAVVYLKNTVSLAIKSYVADADGAFHFGQIGTDADYQVWAQLDGKKSDTKTVSVIVNKSLINVTLKIK